MSHKCFNGNPRHWLNNMPFVKLNEVVSWYLLSHMIGEVPSEPVLSVAIMSDARRMTVLLISTWPSRSASLSG